MIKQISFNDTDFIINENQIYMSNKVYEYMLNQYFTLFLLGLFFGFSLGFFLCVFYPWIIEKIKKNFREV